MATQRPRSHLPIPDPQHVGVTTYDAKDPDTAFPKIEALRPPEGAPNIVLIEAVKYGALPLDDRRVERFLAELAGRPELITGTSQLLYGGMSRLSESSVINTKNVSHSVTADIIVPAADTSGVLVAQGGAFGGWSLYLIGGRPTYCYNLFGIDRTFVRGNEPVGHARLERSTPLVTPTTRRPTWDPTVARP